MQDREDPQDQANPNTTQPSGGDDPHRQLDFELKQARLGLQEARRRDRNATAKIKEQQAAKLGAEAAEARHRAEREPSRQTQALAAGWTRIVLTIAVTVFAMSMLVVGYMISPLAYAPAALAGFGLYPLRPWEFVFVSRPSGREAETSGE